MKYHFIIVFFVSLFYSAVCLSDQNQTNNITPPPEKNAKLNSWQHLETLVSLINNMEQQQNTLRQEIRKTKNTEPDPNKTEEIQQISQDLQSLRTALEMLATGGADLTLFTQKTEEKFNWREQLTSVFEPILVELRRISERPRKIERLRSNETFYTQRLDVAKSAVRSLTNYRNTSPTPQLKQAFSQLVDRWTRKRNELQSRVDLVRFELRETLSPSNAPKTDPIESLKKLLGGRILNLVIALAVMATVYLSLKTIASYYRQYINRKKKRRCTFIARAGTLSFYLFTTLMVLLSGMAVFYIRGDWVLMGLVFIMLAGAAWAIQKSLPQYLIEAKLIMNLGPVREGERIIYNNLPWRVEDLAFQATLVNPLLQGGKLYIPVKDLVNFNSRHYDKSETWFPTRQHDWALLEDGSYGQVVSQSPDYVEFNVFDAIKTYPSTQFIKLNPRNLSLNGFTMLMTFGLDYQHQNDITSIITQMQNHLEEKFQQTDLAANIKKLNISFEKANESSLDLVAEITFDGRAANKYIEIPRQLQLLTVNACNEFNWVIPFKQIKIHTA